MPDIWMDVDSALSEVPVNLMPLIDDTDFKSIEDAVAYNAAGMTLRWHFVTSAGAYTVTSVTPTSGGDYDWTDQGDSGIYTIEIPASGGASINNDTEGYGWFTGKATGVLPWRGPVIGFRAAALNNALCDGGDNLDVNVTQFGGTNGTFSSGRAEVNASHVGGTAISSNSAANWHTLYENDGSVSTLELANVATLYKLQRYVSLLARADAAVETNLSTELGEINTDYGGGAGDYEAVVESHEAYRTLLADISTRIPAALSSGNMKVDVLAISGDTTAADNLESHYDGTGYGNVLQRTTIATLANQQEFTLTAGSADNNAYTLCDIVIQDQTTAAQKTVCSVLTYVGSTKTVFLADSPRFTIATGDIVTIIAVRSYGILINAGSGLDALGTVLDSVDGNVALVKAKTDNLPSDPADASVIVAAFAATDSAVATLTAYVDTEVAAIKAKTDNLPASPAAVGSAMTLTTAYDLYHADIDLRIDEANTRDEYTITWFKNGARIASGITVPTIQVVKRADGTDLIASTTPTQIGSTGSYKHDATTTARTTAGEACVAIATATIDGSTRAFARVVGRDSSA